MMTMLSSERLVRNGAAEGYNPAARVGGIGAAKVPTAQASRANLDGEMLVEMVAEESAVTTFVAAEAVDLGAAAVSRNDIQLDRTPKAAAPPRAGRR